MAKQQTKFEAEDGTEFDSEEEALAYERISQAQLELKRATERLNRALAESLKTADGEPFAFNGTYYVIVQHIWGEDLVRETFYAADSKVNQENAPAIVRSWYDKGYQSQEFPLTSIFKWKRKAMNRQLELRKERLAGVAEAIAELEKEIAKES